MDAIQCADQKPGQITREYLLRIHAPRLAVSAGARTDDKVMCAVYDWFHQRRHKFRDIASVTVHKYDEIAFARDRGYTCGTGTAISADRRNHSGTSVSGAFRGLIGATIINNNHFARKFRRQHFADDLGDRFLLIQRRDNNGNPHIDNYESDCSRWTCCSNSSRVPVGSSPLRERAM